MTPARLSFGTWREFRDDLPVTFFTLAACSPRTESAVSDPWTSPSACGVTLSGTPKRPTRSVRGRTTRGSMPSTADTAMGWETGGTPWVWTECRARAADYLQGLSGDDAPEPLGDGAARWLAARYRSVSDLLNRAADKTASAVEKRRLIAEARAVEASCVGRVGEIRDR